MEYELSEEQFLTVKATLEKELGVEVSMDDAREAFRTIKTLAEVIVSIAMEQCRRKRLLEESPSGFQFDKRGACVICRDILPGEELWFDNNGLKCNTCQRAMNKRIVHASVATDEGSWYSAWHLEYYFKIKKPQLRKLVKAGLLKGRIIEHEGGEVHLQLFLIRDNKSFLPPKHLLKGGVREEIIDGKKWFVTYSWYDVVDPVRYLAKYGISNHLHFND